MKEFADNNLFKFDENGGKFSERVKNTVGKGEIAHNSLRAISPFPTMFLNDLYCRQVKNQRLVWERVKAV